MPQGGIMFTRLVTCTGLAFRVIVLAFAVLVAGCSSPSGSSSAGTTLPAGGEHANQSRDSISSEHAIAPQSEPSVSPMDAPILDPTDAPVLDPNARLQAFCEAQWPNDFRMRLYCQQKQVEGVEKSIV